MASFFSIQKIYHQLFLVGIFFISTFFLVFEKTNASSQDFFTVDNVPIEISLLQDITPVEARQKALSQGAREAFLSLVKRLSPESSTSWDVLINAMTEQEVEAFVADFEVQKEKMSPVFYRTTLTYRFKADKIREFFHKKGVTLQEPKTESLAKPVLVIPLLKTGIKTYLWEEENLWKSLWQEGTLTSSDLPLILPIGDLQDLQLATTTQAEKGDLSALDLLAQKYKATGGVLVIEASLIGEGPAYTESLPLEASSVKVDFLYGVTSLLPKQRTFTIPEEPNSKMSSTRLLLDQAIRKTIQILNTNWVKGTLDQTGYETPITVQATFSSKKEWMDIQKALKNLTSQNKIKGFKVDSLSQDSAWLQIIFLGEPLSILPNFKQQGTALTKEKGYWQITSSPQDPTSPQSLSPTSHKDSLQFDNVVLQLF